MSDINLFEIGNNVKELPASSVVIEKELQTLIEKNMETFFGIKFLATEYSITGGRIDSLGLDENYSPVIFEYKRSKDENIINQGLYYLDWLLDHKADFYLLVKKTLGDDVADKIDWSVPCVICIASDFTKFDEHAVNQMRRNIKLVRYKKFGENFILFEHLNTPKIKAVSENTISISRPDIEQRIENTPENIKMLFLSIRDYILSKGDDVSENVMKHYVAFKKIKNIVCAEVSTKEVCLYLKLNPEKEDLISGFTRDMRKIGHYGTGDLEVIIKTQEDYERAKLLIDKVYDVN